MKNYIYTLLLLASISFMSCQGNSTSKEIADAEEADSFVSDTTYTTLASKSIADDTLAIVYKPIMEKYLELSDALIEAQPLDASRIAVEMELLFKKANLKIATNENKNIWGEQADAIVIFLNKIAASKDLKVQRNEFYPLSQDVYDLYAKIGLKGFTIYKQFCPMAFNDKGAFWLSKSEDILNPYFGSTMLHCGEIKEKISNP